MLTIEETVIVEMTLEEARAVKEAILDMLIQDAEALESDPALDGSDADRKAYVVRRSIVLGKMAGRLSQV